MDRVLPVLELTRVGLVYTAISNIWLIVLLSDGLGLTSQSSRALDSIGLGGVLLCTAAVAGGMYAFGMALNDVMDARRDAALGSDRPIPAGRVSVRDAMAIAVGALVISVAGSVPLGQVSTLLCLVCAVLVLFYNTAGKHVPGVGIVTLGLIRGTHMLIANPSIEYCWPILLTVTHVVGISAAGYRLEEKRPELRGRGLWTMICGWVVIAVGLIVWMETHGRITLGDTDGGAWAWVGPLAAVAVFAVWAVVMGRRAGSGRRAGGLIVKRGLLWLIVYDVAWLAGARLWGGAITVGLLGVAAIVTMWAIRHARAMSEPAGFRRERPAPSDS